MKERNIFIGLGGSGVNTVAALKYKIYANATGENPWQQMEENYKFLFVDTDQADIDKMNTYYKSKYESGRRPFIDPNHDLLNLGKINPWAVYEEARAKNAAERSSIDNAILEACPAKTAATLKPYPLNQGAGAFRYNSRIAFARVAGDFVAMLKRCIQQLLDTRTAGSEGVTLNYWIVASCNGGTGSGTFNDVLYLANKIHKTFRHREEPKVTLVMYMPRFYIDANKGDKKYICNAQAAFHEMNGFQSIARSGTAQMQAAAHQMMFQPSNLPIEENTPYRPFSSCIPIDIQTENGNSLMEASNMYANTAELLYFIHQSQGRDPEASSFKSDADNHLDEIVTLAPLHFLEPMGYVALRKPEPEFDNYIHHRLQLDLLKYGLLSPISEETDIQADVAKLYDDLIGRELFSGQNDTFSNEIDALVTGQIGRSFSDNLLKEDDKPRTHLTSGISQAAADKVVAQFTMAIDDLYEGRDGGGGEISRFSRKAVLRRIDDNIWKWVEEQTLRKGLNYVKQVLDGLDLYASQIFSGYATGRQAEGVSALTENVKHIQEQLPDLYRKADEVTFKEKTFLDSNEHDVRQYYTQLLEYIKAKGRLILAEKKYDLLAALCKGDNGLIDKIRFYVNELKEAAIGALKAPEANYYDLARFFENSARDITTVYLPDISKFIKNGGWEPDNYFARLYGEVLEPSHHLVPGYGFRPVRSIAESKEKSVEAFLRKTIECNKKEMIAEGYYHEEAGNSHSMLFHRNRWSENPGKIIEDLTMYFKRTYEKNYKPGRLSERWYNVTLEALYMQLTQSERDKIQANLYPQLFYSYKNAIIDSSKEFKYVIAPTTQMAVDVFHFQEGDATWRHDKSTSTSVAYMLRAKIGLPLASYMPSDMINEHYNREITKSIYHTHTAWGECNGDYRRLKLEDRVDRELIVFAKYLLLDAYTRAIPDLFYQPENIAEKDNYSPTPLVIIGETMSFALPGAIDIIKDYVALHCDRHRFEEYVAPDAALLYSSIYKLFKQSFIANQHEVAIHDLLNQFADNADIKRMYNKVKNALVERLTLRWQEAAREDEKKCLLALIRLFDDEKELADYLHFMNIR